VHVNISNETATARASPVWTIWFCACLIPLTTADGIGVNYLYVLSPLFVLVIHGRLKRPPQFVAALVMLFTTILITASIYQIDWIDEGARRIVSFAVFLSIFTFSVIDVTPRMIKSFLLALVLVSLFLSCRALTTYVLLGPESLGWGAKDAVGTQRIGFIYVWALWVAAYWPQRHPSARTAMVKPLVIGLIAIGLFLTFSRSSIVALAASVVANMAYSAIASKRNPIMAVAYIVLPIALLTVALAVLARYFPVIIDFYNQRLLDFFVSGAVVDALEQSDTSEGSRLEIWRAILDFVGRNPLTGTGFLGVWVIYDAAGSAHNQFMDTLLRLGAVGALAYFAMLFAIGRHLYHHHAGLFVGFLSVLVYGLFHETFKESQGAFALAFVVGIYAAHLRRMRRLAADSTVDPPPGGVLLRP
jgi:O-antigen ligase